MPINKNHEFEDLNGVKCSIVEKNATKERVDFLRELLTYNGYEVIVVASPPAKVAPAPKTIVAPATDHTDPALVPPAPATPVTSPALPETFTVGVTDVMFNPTNAVFGRLLRTQDGHVVTLAYWEQKEKVSNDEIPYFQKCR
jgi:hypothetical protein